MWGQVVSAFPSKGRSRRSPKRLIQPIWRAGTPAINAKSGTSRLIMAPAATNELAPMVMPQPMVQLAPRVAPMRTRVLRVLVLAGDRRAGLVHVGKDHAGAAEDVIFKLDVVVHGNSLWELSMATTPHAAQNHITNLLISALGCVKLTRSPVLMEVALR